MSLSSTISRVGILIPTYNRREYLQKSLESALCQSFAALEVIVIDNGSTDGTAALMAEVNDPRVRFVVNEQNIGIVGSINKGVRLFSSSVRWATILPDDDLLDKDFVRKMLELAAKEKVKAVISCKVLLIDGNAGFIRNAKPIPSFETALEYLKNRSCLKRESFLTGTFFSREAFEKISGYPQFSTGMCTDDAFIFALAFGSGLYFSTDAVASVRIHDEAESQQPTGAGKHISALNDFSNYVISLVSNRGDVPINLKKVLGKYVAHLASSLWIRSIKALLKNRPDDIGSQMDSLMRVVECNSGINFSLRVKTSIFITRFTGFCPEAYILYRVPWEAFRHLRNI